MRNLALLFLAAAAPATAQTMVNPLIDYPGFEKVTAEAKAIRAQRLLSLKQWKAMAKEGDALILDARSESAFRQGHIKGAVNLPFSDFTADALAEVIGANRDRRILIYCNNNFTNNKAPVVTKALPLALNIPTFINLVGYGYANVWELGEAVDFNDPKVGWVRG